METIARCLHPDSQDPAIVLPGRHAKTISHSSLADNVLKVRQSLAVGQIHKGKKVAMVLPNPHLLTLVLLATTLQSCVAGPLNSNLKAPEFEFYYADFGADLVVVSEDDVAKSSPAYVAAKGLGIPTATCSVKHGVVTLSILHDLANNLDDLSIKADEDNGPSASTPALVLHTSGTTGRPKAVSLTHGNIAASITNIIKHYNFEISDRTSLIMPLFHIHGIVCALLTPLAVGTAVIFPTPPSSGITPSFLRDAATHSATWYTATPTLHRLVLKLPEPSGVKPKFRFARSCSSPLDVRLLTQLEEKLGCVVTEAYAMTEAAHQVCSNPVDVDKRRPGSVGLPTGVEIKILDDDGNLVADGQVGEVCISGPNLMDGYLANDEANQKSFVHLHNTRYFRTGDQGNLDTDGYLTLTGRIKELINKGGEKISPVEVDDVVNKHECVAEAVTFAIPDEMYGEEVAVAVTLREGKEVGEKDLQKWIGERLAQAKVPRKVFLVGQIPKTAVGKVQRALVAKTLTAGDELRV